MFMTLNRSQKRKRMTRATRRALEVFRSRGGTLRFSEAQRAGIHPALLYRLRNQGVLQAMARGVYRLSDLPTPTHPDLVIVSRAVPRGVICMISALAWYELTSEIPHAIDCALPRGNSVPHLRHPPLRLHWFSGAAYSEGIETHTIDGTPVRIYSPEKTLADCFKYRNKLGIDTVLDALRRYRAKYGLRVDALTRYARVCRVDSVMRPYLEATL
jgi:predicted transcriptional regulator of viral defense system